MSSNSSSSQQSHDETEYSTSAITTITTLHPDIIHAHILSRLDGTTLAAASASSSHLRRLCTADHLWHQICTATWPSLSDPTASHVISKFPAGHRSIFSDAFPSLHHLPKNHRHRPSPLPDLPEELISAVDIHYNGKHVFSKVRKTETRKNWFLSSPFWIDALEPDEWVPTPVKLARASEEWLTHLEESLSLSWILIDPSNNRAVNLSSRLPVSARRHWLTRELEVVYAVVVVAAEEMEAVRCVVKVTCGGKVGGEMHVREVSLAMEDVDGGHVRGDEGVRIVRKVMECGERKKVVDAKERYEWFERVKRERREARHRREKVKGVVATVMMFFAFILLCWIAGI